MEKSSSEQCRERSETTDFSSWCNSTSKRLVVQSVSRMLRIQERWNKALRMDFDEVIENVKRRVKAFFVD